MSDYQRPGPQRPNLTHTELQDMFTQLVESSHSILDDALPEDDAFKLEVQKRLHSQLLMALQTLASSYTVDGIEFTSTNALIDLLSIQQLREMVEPVDSSAEDRARELAKHMEALTEKVTTIRREKPSQCVSDYSGALNDFLKRATKLKQDIESNKLILPRADFPEVTSAPSEYRRHLEILTDLREQAVSAQLILKQDDRKNAFIGS